MKGSFIAFLLLPFVSFSQTIVAKFTATPTAGCVPLVVNFTDQSTGNPTSWKWDFGNGSTSNTQNTGITYFLPGTYTVKLVVKNANNTDSLVKSQYIKVDLPPVPNFNSLFTLGCSPLPVQFKDSSLPGTGSIVSWLWDFGDGNSSTQQNPTHVYSGVGNFTVTEWVTNSTGCIKIVSKPAFVKLLGTPVASFSHSISQGCTAPAIVTFNNTSSALLASYFWDFGDGTTSTQFNPVHNYTTRGLYTVKLIVKNANGCTDTLIKPNAINVQFATADFTIATGICVGSAVTFSNTSVPNTISSKWSFGDGTTSTAINPSKAFTNPGTYQVKLVNNFGNCIDSTVKAITVTTKPVPAFTATNNIDCKTPLTVSFNNTSAGASGYIWNFGDGSTSTLQNPTHTYTQAGDFTVTLTAASSSGCADMIIKANLVQIHPPKINGFSNLPVKGCLPFTITPVAAVQSNQPITSYFWDFGDGNTSTLANPVYTYTTEGSFKVSLTITNAQGCTDTYSSVGAVKVGNKPVADFSANPVSSCAGIPLNFKDESTGSKSEWLWVFGDGTTSTLQNPVHPYFDTGKFSVTLIVKNFGCTDTIKKVDYVAITPPVAMFDTAFLCSNRLSRQFIDKSIAAESWLWSFGDGDSTSQSSPAHTYANAGEYTVELTVTNGACINKATKLVKVLNASGQLTVNTPEVCKGTPMIFNISSLDTSNVLQYAWHFAGINTPTSVTTGTIPVMFTFPSIGERLPAVITIDSLGCVDTLTLANPVKIFGPVASFAPAQPGICIGTPITFLDSSTTDGVHPITKWMWNYGNGVTQTQTAAPFQYTYGSAGLFSVGLIIEDSFGCRDSLFKPDAVNATKSDARFTSLDTLTCPGAPVNFTAQSAGSNVTYDWDFGDGTTSTLQNPVHPYSNSGSYTVRLKVLTDGGCIETITKNNFIKVDKPKARFSVSDTFVCQPIQVAFRDSSNYASSWSWMFDNGNTSTLQNPVNVFSSSQLYNVKLLVTSPGGCQDSAFKLINVDLLSATLSYTPLIACAPAKVSFVAHSSRPVDYTWNFGDGNSLTTSDSVASNTFLSGGKYLPQILLRDIRGCIVPVNGIDTIEIEKVVANFVSDQRVVCDSGTVRFTDSSSAIGTLSYQWWFGDGGTSTLKNPTHKYTQTGSYAVKLIVTSSLSGCQDSISPQNFIAVNTTVTPSVSITASSTTICDGKNITFTATPINGGANPTYQWKVNGVNAGSNSPVFSTTAIADNDVVSCILFSSLPCITTPAANSNGIKITVNINLTPAITITASAVNICTKTSASFTAQGVNGGLNPIYQWKINGRNVGTNSTTFSSSSFNNGDIVTCVLTSSETCTTFPTAISNAIKMTVYNYPVVDAGPDLIVLEGWQGNLNPTVSAVDARIRWTPPTYLSSDTVLRPLTRPTADINYKITVTGIGGCSSSDSMFVKVTKLIIPNVFSPNGDGINDKWIINNIFLFADAEVDIFNRYGQLLFRSTGYEQPWDGTYNGSPLPVATYYYVIRIRSQNVKPFGGSITILR